MTPLAFTLNALREIDLIRGRCQICLGVLRKQLAVIAATVGACEIDVCAFCSLQRQALKRRLAPSLAHLLFANIRGCSRLDI